MHIDGKYNWLKHFDFILIDVFSLVSMFVVSYYIKFGDFSCFVKTEWLALLLFVCLIDVVITLLTNPYSGIFRRTYYEEIVKQGFLTVTNLIVACIIFYVLKIGVLFSREMLLEMYFLYFVLSLFLKYLWKRLIISGKVKFSINNAIPLYIVCDKKREQEVVHNALTGDFKQYELKGVAYEDGFVSDAIARNVKEVLIASDPGFISESSYQKLIDNGIGIHLSVESIINMQTENQTVNKVGVYRTLSVGTFDFTPEQMVYFSVKRLFDIIFGLVGLLILLPLSLVVKLSYVLDGDRDSILYTQKRIGLNGREIRIFKFRSMVSNAEEVLNELLKDPVYLKEWQENQKFENDPRITRIGKFLRKTSLDEFPQFINVLNGDMSLVGPRPLVEGELEAHDGLKLYQRVKPGITGWWGCNGRSNIDYRERLDLEYYYVRNCSLYLDVICILRTIVAVIKKEGSK